MSPFGDFPKCVNCGFQLPKQVNAFNVVVSELKPRERVILDAWMQPQEVVDSQRLCSMCHYKLIAAVDASSPRQYGHPTVCVVCGRSAHHKFKYRSLQAKADKPAAIFILEHCSTFLINNDGRVCSSCWMKATRYLSKLTQKPVERNQLAEHKGEKVQEKTDNVKNESTVQVNSNTTEAVPDKGKNLQKTEIEVEGYSKVVVLGGHRCVACGATVSAALGLPARRNLLIQRRLYTPSAAPVCETHTKPESWPTTIKTVDIFTADDIDDMVFVMRYLRAIDLSQPANIDLYARRIWLGVEPDEFETILARNPKLLMEGVKGRLALGVWLAKQRTGESERVLASLTQRSARAVEAGLKLAESAGLGSSTEVPTSK